MERCADVLTYLSPDPRFEGGGGSSKLNYDIFRKAYGFLGTYQDSEIEELKKSLKKEKDQVQRIIPGIMDPQGPCRTRGAWCPFWIRADGNVDARSACMDGCVVRAFVGVVARS